MKHCFMFLPLVVFSFSKIYDLNNRTLDLAGVLLLF